MPTISLASSPVEHASLWEEFKTATGRTGGRKALWAGAVREGFLEEGPNLGLRSQLGVTHSGDHLVLFCFQIPK